MSSKANKNSKTDVLHNGTLDNCTNFSIFKRRYPKRLVVPTRVISNWYLQLVGKGLCIVGVYKNVLIRTSQIISVIEPRKICTNNCIYILSTNTDLKQHPIPEFEGFKFERHFEKGFPDNWCELLDAFLDKSIKNIANIEDDNTTEGLILRGSLGKINSSISVERRLSESNTPIHSINELEKEDISEHNDVLSEADVLSEHELINTACSSIKEDNTNNSKIEDSLIEKNDVAVHLENNLINSAEDKLVNVKKDNSTNINDEGSLIKTDLSFKRTSTGFFSKFENIELEDFENRFNKESSISTNNNSLQTIKVLDNQEESSDAVERFNKIVDNSKLFFSKENTIISEDLVSDNNVRRSLIKTNDDDINGSNNTIDNVGMIQSGLIINESNNSLVANKLDNENGPVEKETDNLKDNDYMDIIIKKFSNASNGSFMNKRDATKIASSFSLDNDMNKDENINSKLSEVQTNNEKKYFEEDEVSSGCENIIKKINEKIVVTKRSSVNANHNQSISDDSFNVLKQNSSNISEYNKDHSLITENISKNTSIKTLKSIIITVNKDKKNTNSGFNDRVRRLSENLDGVDNSMKRNSPRHSENIISLINVADRKYNDTLSKRSLDSNLNNTNEYKRSKSMSLNYQDSNVFDRSELNDKSKYDESEKIAEPNIDENEKSDKFVNDQDRSISDISNRRLSFTNNGDKNDINGSHISDKINNFIGEQDVHIVTNGDKNDINESHISDNKNNFINENDVHMAINGDKNDINGSHLSDNKNNSIIENDVHITMGARDSLNLIDKMNSDQNNDKYLSKRMSYKDNLNMSADIAFVETNLVYDSNNRMFSKSEDIYNVISDNMKVSEYPKKTVSSLSNDSDAYYNNKSKTPKKITKNKLN